MGTTSPTVAPSGSWLDQILQSASDIGDKFLAWKMFDNLTESQAADRQDNPYYNGGYGYYGESPYGYTTQPQANNTMMFLVLGVSAVAFFMMMKK